MFVKEFNRAKNPVDVAGKFYKKIKIKKEALFRGLF